MGKVIEVTEDDNTLLMLDFGGSSFAVMDGTYNINAAKSPWIELFGRKETINVNNYPAIAEGAPPFEVYRTEALPGTSGWIAPDHSAVQQQQERFNTLHTAAMVEHLVASMRSGHKPVLSAEHARHALEIMLTAQVSARTGQAVELQTTF